MKDQNLSRLHTFASLRWYDETIKFVFNFVTKTSELLLAAGVVISTANFLTDGNVMSHDKILSDAWSWTQAIAIDSSLGMVFMNALQAVRERDKIKAVIFLTLTVLLATVAGLVTHFDALSHVSGLPMNDKGVSGIIPLWVMTALRSAAVIGFLLASRLKGAKEDAMLRIAQVYKALCAERQAMGDNKPISARDLAKRANVRRSTCGEWLQQHGQSLAQEAHSHVDSFS